MYLPELSRQLLLMFVLFCRPKQFSFSPKKLVRIFWHDDSAIKTEVESINLLPLSMSKYQVDKDFFAQWAFSSCFQSKSLNKFHLMGCSLVWIGLDIEQMRLHISNVQLLIHRNKNVSCFSIGEFLGALGCGIGTGPVLCHSFSFSDNVITLLQLQILEYT